MTKKLGQLRALKIQEGNKNTSPEFNPTYNHNQRDYITEIK